MASAKCVVAVLVQPALAVLAATPVLAQTINIQSVTAISLGTAAAASSGSTVFTIDPSTGKVTKSGNGTRVATTDVRSTVTLRCTGTTVQCDNAIINVRVASTGAPTGRALAMSNLTVASGTAIVATLPAPGNPINFQISPIGRNVNKTFFVGGDYTIAGDDVGGTTGVSNAPFNVQVAVAPAATAAPGSTANVTANVYRSLAITKVSDLNFGAMFRPAATTTVQINAGTGARTPTNTMVYLTNPAPTRAQFNISGEGGRIVTVTAPTSVALTRSGGAQTLTLTLTRNPGGNVTLPGTLGTTGSATLGIGGSISVGPATTTGVYSGSFNVVFSYN